MLTPRWRCCLALYASALSVAAAAPLNYYISPTGSDANGDGSISNPWASLTKAQSAVRSVNQAMSGDVIVNLRGGTYFLGSTLELTPLDSGSNGFFVRYAAYGVEKPVVHGGLPITGWAVVDASKNIWAASFPPAVNDTRQVYINGERMNSTFTAGGLGPHVKLTNWGYTTPDAFPALFLPGQAQRDIEFRYTGVGSSWTECRLRVESITALPGGGINVTMQQPGYSLGRNKYFGQGVTAPASITNVYGAMTAPGDSYVNSVTKTIYYIPRPQDNMATATVIVPGPTEILLRLQGDTSTPKINPVKFVTFEGLQFSYAGWLEPNNGWGYVDMQSAFRVTPTSSTDDDSWVPVPGNIQMHTVENVTVRGCTFSGLGATALEIDNQSQSVQVCVALVSFAHCMHSCAYFHKILPIDHECCIAGRQQHVPRRELRRSLRGTNQRCQYDGPHTHQWLYFR